LKLGWTTASLLIKKFNAMPRQNALVKSLQEYGRMIKTIFILRYLSSEDYRRQINTQHNKGELLHALRRYLFIANEAQIRKRQPEEQLNQAACLNPVTNAVVVWNSVYMWGIIKQLKAEGFKINQLPVRTVPPNRRVKQRQPPEGENPRRSAGVNHGNQFRRNSENRVVPLKI